jgi:hypothetical protein
MAACKGLERDDFLVARLSWRPWVPDTGTNQRHLSRVEHSHWGQCSGPRLDQHKEANTV